MSLFALQPTQSPISSAVCASQTACNEKREELGFAVYYVGNYPTKGCFSRAGVAYYGTGGTSEQISEADLDDGNERIWCVTTTDSPSKAPVTVATEYCMNIEVVTDDYGQETGFSLARIPKVAGDEPEILFEFPVGSLASKTAYTGDVCVPKGRYIFTVEDEMYGTGAYTVKLDGEEIIHGAFFPPPSISYEIRAGYNYQPATGTSDAEWLEAHNTRRVAFHEDNDKEYRPLKWSPSLKDDAAKWLEEVLPTCEMIREPGIDEGENLTVMRLVTQDSADKTPDQVMVSCCVQQIIIVSIEYQPLTKQFG